jgi:NTP pyrophosphatase (non-canonical NTP hydrolase)
MTQKKGTRMPDQASQLLPQSYKSLEQLQQEFDRYQEAAFPKRGANFFALELNGEAGELANLEKKAWKGKEIASEDFADEAADVCIALLNYANSRGIDLAKAVQTKMAVIDKKRLDGTH